MWNHGVIHAIKLSIRLGLFTHKTSIGSSADIYIVIYTYIYIYMYIQYICSQSNADFHRQPPLVRPRRLICGSFVFAMHRVYIVALNAILGLRLNNTGRTVGRTHARLSDMGNTETAWSF